MGISPKSEIRCHNFPVFENLIFFFLMAEEREVVAARFRLWVNAHTRWRSARPKALMKCVVSIG